MNVSRSRFRFLPFLCVAVLSSASAWAGGPVLAEAPGVAITTDDLKGDALRIPANARPQALSQADAVQQVANSLLLRRALAAQAEKAGLAQDPVMAAALRVARDRVLSDAMLEKIDQQNKPADEAVEAAARAAYRASPERFRTGDQTQARHILIAGNTEKAKEKAEKVLAELKSGADFAKVASESSDDPGSAAKGGDLGFFEKGKMVPEFDEALDKLQKPGDMSGLVRSQFGWHIIQLEGRRPGGIRSYEEVRDQLRQMVTGQLQNEARQREASRLIEGTKLNREAIEAFAASYRGTR